MKKMILVVCQMESSDIRRKRQTGWAVLDRCEGRRKGLLGLGVWVEFTWVDINEW